MTLGQLTVELKKVENKLMDNGLQREANIVFTAQEYIKRILRGEVLQ